MMRSGKDTGTMRRAAAALRILPALALALFLAGCQDAAGTADLTQGQEQKSIVSELTEQSDSATGAEVQVNPGDETAEQRMGDNGTDKAETALTDSGVGTEPQSENAVAAEVPISTEKKEPPAGWELKLASEDWGLSFGEAGTQPVGNASAEDLAWCDAYYVGDDDEKIIYLTFDCGYENGNTEPILDALKKHDVQATFFVVGHFLETAPDMAKRMVTEGHTVGNHTYHHLDMPTISDQETFQSEMDDVADLFYDITGTKLSPYYRPPQGKCNVQNLEMAQKMGYHTIFWSLAYVDWDQDKQPGHEEAFDKLTSRVHPGAIVLLHNTSQTNGEILDELLTRWEEMGYSFGTLAELTGN